MIRKYKRDERAPTPPGAKKVASAGGAAARDEKIRAYGSERDWRTLFSFRATRRVVFVAMTHRTPFYYRTRRVFSFSKSFS